MRDPPLGGGGRGWRPSSTTGRQLSGTRGGDGEPTLDQDESGGLTGVFLPDGGPLHAHLWAWGGSLTTGCHFQADNNFPGGRLQTSPATGHPGGEPRLGLHWAATEESNLYMKRLHPFESPTTPEAGQRARMAPGGSTRTWSRSGGMVGRWAPHHAGRGRWGWSWWGSPHASPTNWFPSRMRPQPGRVFFPERRLLPLQWGRGGVGCSTSTGAAPWRGTTTGAGRRPGSGSNPWWDQDFLRTTSSRAVAPHGWRGW